MPDLKVPTASPFIELAPVVDCFCGGGSSLCIATCDCCLTPPSSRYDETAVELKRAGGKI